MIGNAYKSSDFTWQLLAAFLLAALSLCLGVGIPIYQEERSNLKIKVK